MIPQFILASASPARRRLLQLAGINPIVQASDFDESLVQSTDPTTLVQTLALRKAETVAAQLAQTGTTAPLLVLGCDSVLAINDEIHGKPANPEEAIARWQQMRGQVGGLYTGHALIKIPPGLKADDSGQRGSAKKERIAPQQSSSFPFKTLVRCQITWVNFAYISDRQIAAYVATGEPLHCAGCFALEGKGSVLVEKIDGCHSNVIGLSMPLLRQMFQAFNYDIADFWAG